jgi:hypothetical protein
VTAYKEKIAMRKIVVMVLCHLLVFLWAQQGEAARTMTVKIGRGEVAVAHIEGSAQVLSEGQDGLRTLKVNDLLKKGDEISTGPKSKMELVMPDKSQLRFADNSRFRLVQMDAGEEQVRDVKVHVTIGKAWANVSKSIAGKSNFELTCENAVAGVRGTVYRMNVNEDKSALIKVYDGTVIVAGGGPAFTPRVPVGPPQKIAGPHTVPGPRKVTMEEWTFIIKSMQQIGIGSDGTPEKPRDFTEQEDRDDWVDWNKKRDSELN